MIPILLIFIFSYNNVTIGKYGEHSVEPYDRARAIRKKEAEIRNDFSIFICSDHSWFRLGFCSNMKNPLKVKVKSVDRHSKLFLLPSQHLIKILMELTKHFRPSQKQRRHLQQNRLNMLLLVRLRVDARNQLF